MMERFIIDTDVMIDVLRKNPLAEAFMMQAITEHCYLSVLTLTEITAGSRNTKEERMFEIVASSFNILNVDHDIAVQAGIYSKTYDKSHGAGVVDCLIAATAALEGLTLVTLNKKHFPMIEKKLIPYKKN